MSTESEQAAWMNEQTRVSLEELAALSGLPDAALRELVEYGVLLPLNPDEVQWTFSAHCVVTVRTAGRLHNDFDLDPNALALTLTLLERIRALETRLQGLQAQIPRPSDRDISGSRTG